MGGKDAARTYLRAVDKQFERAERITEAILAEVENGPWVLIGDPEQRELVRRHVFDALKHIAAEGGLDEALAGIKAAEAKR